MANALLTGNARSDSMSEFLAKARQLADLQTIPSTKHEKNRLGALNRNQAKRTAAAQDRPVEHEATTTPSAGAQTEASGTDGNAMRDDGQP